MGLLLLLLPCSRGAVSTATCCTCCCGCSKKHICGEILQLAPALSKQMGPKSVVIPVTVAVASAGGGEAQAKGLLSAAGEWGWCRGDMGAFVITRGTEEVPMAAAEGGETGGLLKARAAAIAATAGDIGLLGATAAAAGDMGYFLAAGDAGFLTAGDIGVLAGEAGLRGCAGWYERVGVLGEPWTDRYGPRGEKTCPTPPRACGEFKGTRKLVM